MLLLADMLVNREHLTSHSYVSSGELLRAELEASERDRKALAEARELVGRHLEAEGECGMAYEGDGFCDESDCTYCAIARSPLGKRTEPTDG